MTFRDDHDAAIARADALERDLQTAREKAADMEQQLQSERAERLRLEANLGTPKRAPVPIVEEPRRPHIPLWRDAGDEPRGDIVGVILAVAIFFALGLFALALGLA